MRREIKPSPASISFMWQDKSNNAVSLEPDIYADEVTHRQLLCGRSPDNAVTITLHPGRSNNGNGYFAVASASDPSTILFEQWVCDVTYFATCNRERDALYILYQGLRETFKWLRENDICDIPYSLDINDTADDSLYIILTQFLNSCLRVLMYSRFYEIECGMCVRSPHINHTPGTPEQFAELTAAIGDIVKRGVQERHPDIKLD